MANPSPAELESLVFELLTVTQSYSDAQDLNGYMSRVQIIDKAKKLIRSLVAPEMMPNYHGLNVRPPTVSLHVFRWCPNCFDWVFLL